MLIKDYLGFEKLGATIQGYLFTSLLKIKLYLHMKMQYGGGLKKLASKS